ncbi:hypothetical protein DCC81_06545 [Chitinophaga parva]|uniref:Uncharacterized protein n=1 Tax=Chitinophaga parva TaxID=2169414 RepID=A0A2T7BN63_9BACT|nr:hypothetical protein DCC81_06545 [Chitinophaga parva]
MRYGQRYCRGAISLGVRYADLNKGFKPQQDCDPDAFGIFKKMSHLINGSAKEGALLTFANERRPTLRL